MKTLVLFGFVSVGALAAAPRRIDDAPIKPLRLVAKGRADAGVEGGKEIRTIPIDESRSNKIYEIQTAPGIPAIIEFPESFSGPPSCGDCLDATASEEVRKASSALFVIQTFASENYIAIKPRQYSQREGGEVPENEFVTTVTVRLQSKLTVTLLLKYASRGKADARVRFTLPNRASESQYVQERIAKEKAQLEAAFAERVSAGASQSFLEALLAPHQCSNASERARVDNVVLEVLELCRFGQRVFIRFSVENRSRSSVFALGELTLKKGPTGKELEPVDGLRKLMGRDEVEFQKVVAGVVGFELAEGEEPAKAFELRIVEGGGKQREVVVSGFGF